jgi:hypothetical protein
VFMGVSGNDWSDLLKDTVKSAYKGPGTAQAAGTTRSSPLHIGCLRPRIARRCWPHLVPLRLAWALRDHRHRTIVVHRGHPHGQPERPFRGMRNGRHWWYQLDPHRHQAPQLPHRENAGTGRQMQGHRTCLPLRVIARSRTCSL